MFRTLFISLLILSALVSEGIVNIPPEYCNIYLADINKLDLLNDYEKDIKDSALKNNGAESNIIIPAGTDGRLFVLSPESCSLYSCLNDFTKFENKCISDTKFNEYNNNNNNTKGSFLRFSGIEFYAYCSSDIIIKISDSSPPLKQV